MADVSFGIDDGDVTMDINGTTSDYHLLSYDGIEAVDIDLSMADNAQGDGGSIKSIRVPPRSIRIEFFIIGETHRASSINFLKPKYKYALYIIRNGVTRKIDCYLATRPEYRQDNINLPIYVTLELICPDPYFYNPSVTTSNETSANVITVTNSGDVECGFVITIRATGGSVVNPYFTLAGTGEFVYVIQNIAATKPLQVSTVQGNCFAKYDGAVIYTYSLDSEFFKLAVGSNTITFGADTGETYIVAKISYYPRYLGV